MCSVRKRIAFRYLSRFFFVLAVCAAGSAAVEAISVSQSEIQVVLPRGEMHSFSFELVNDEDQTLDLALRIVDWTESSDGVTTILPVGSHDRSLVEQVILHDGEVHLLPGQSAVITIEVTLDPRAEGTYWAGCLIQEMADSAVHDETSVSASRQLLIRMLYTTPDAQPSARVSDLWVSGSNPITVHAEITNDGTTALGDVACLFSAEDTEGGTVFESSVQEFSLLPGSCATVSVRAPWTTDASGMYLVRAVSDFGGDTLIAGQIVIRLDPLLLVPIGASEAVPRDLDGDGWYEDVDGDGDATFADVRLFTEFIDDSGVTGNVRAFDFDNDGRITISDVDALEQTIREAA